MEPQLRRPEIHMALIIKFNLEILDFNLNYDYRHVGQVEDWKNGTVRSKVDSSDIMNISLSKDISGSIWSLNVLNLTDENYQRPDTYNQEGRRFELSFSNKY